MRNIHNAEVDLNYTLYYPLLKAYVSLYPKQQKEAGDTPMPPDGPKGDTDMWKIVEKAMEEHTLEELRESKDGVTIPGAPESNKYRNTIQGGKKDKQYNKKRDAKAESNGVEVAMKDEDEEGSDEDFFV